MRIYLAFAAFMAILALGCKPDEPVYFQPEHSIAVIRDTEPLDAKLCIVLGTEYYIKDYFVYIYTDTNASVVMTRIGVYRYDRQLRNWNLIPHRNKEDNIYIDTLGWISQGQLDSGDTIACKETEEVPKVFYDFYRVYKPLYDKANNATASELL